MTHTALMSPAPQHLQALERANAVRLARAHLKRRIARGDTTAAEVILSSPWEVESMTIGDLLTSQRRWGATRCRRLLQAVPISESKAVGAMTDRQRQALAAMLGEQSAPTRAAADRVAAGAAAA